jgi:hypothetical protein
MFSGAHRCAKRSADGASLIRHSTDRPGAPDLAVRWFALSGIARRSPMANSSQAILVGVVRPSPRRRSVADGKNDQTVLRHVATAWRSGLMMRLRIRAMALMSFPGFSTSAAC